MNRKWIVMLALLMAPMPAATTSVPRTRARLLLASSRTRWHSRSTLHPSRSRRAFWVRS